MRASAPSRRSLYLPPMRFLRFVAWVFTALLVLGVIADLATRKWTALAGDLVLALFFGLIVVLLRRR